MAPRSWKSRVRNRSTDHRRRRKVLHTIYGSDLHTGYDSAGTHPFWSRGLVHAGRGDFRWSNTSRPCRRAASHRSHGLSMHLTATGTEQRRSLVLILHKSSEPVTTMVHDWTPK